jgi:hypothetical protein
MGRAVSRPRFFEREPVRVTTGIGAACWVALPPASVDPARPSHQRLSRWACDVGGGYPYMRILPCGPFPPFPFPLFLHRILFLASCLGYMVCRIVQDCPVMVGHLARQPRCISHGGRGDTGAPGLRPHALAQRG